MGASPLVGADHVTVTEPFPADDAAEVTLPGATGITGVLDVPLEFAHAYESKRANMPPAFEYCPAGGLIALSKEKRSTAKKT